MTANSIRKRSRDSAETRRRLLEAATEEFAAHGIAGGRVDRIAANAGCNKQAIYAYYGNKRGLFEAVYDAMVDRVPLEGDDLPGYAARLFDYHQRSPALARLSSWYHLEKSRSAALPEAASRKVREEIARIRLAQQRGLVTDRISPEYLLAFIFRLALVGVMGSTEWWQPGQSDSELRASIVEAVRRMIAP